MTRRVRARRGFSVALIGPDGAGKTTVARRLPGRLSRPTSYVYMGVAVESSSHLLPTTRLVERVKRRRARVRSTALAPTGPGSATPPPTAGGAPTRRRRGGAKGVLRGAASSLKLVNRLAEEWYRQGIVWRAVRRGRVVVLDRHFYIDYHAADVVAADRTIRRRIHGWVLANLYPRPDLTIYLDAPAEVLLARKGEGTLESLERRRSDYLAVGQLVPHFEVVDATRPLEVVIDDVVVRVEAFANGRPAGAASIAAADR